MRIQARAVRRCGELLKEFEPAKNQYDAQADGGPSRAQAAQEAGLSKRQEKTAVRVANVPEEEFEAQIESDSPPTVTALAEQGTQKKVFDPFDLIDSGISFEDHKLATHVIGVGQELSKFITKGVDVTRTLHRSAIQTLTIACMPHPALMRVNSE
jgi:hypothetical protein